MPRGTRSVRANRRGANAVRRSESAYAASYPPGSHTFTPPKAGYYLFVLWGPGQGSTGFTEFLASPSGCYCEYTDHLDPTQRVALTVSAGVPGGSTATTATFPDGKVVSAGPGNSLIATGGDVNLLGSAGGTGAVAPSAGSGTGGGAAGSGLSGGGGAPGVLPFRGGAGGASQASGTAPGGGAGDTGTGDKAKGGDGQVLVLFLGASRTRPA